MKVVVCGAGQVGSTIAAYLADEGNAVTVIDQDPQVIAQLNDAVEVQGIVGHAAHPEVLEKAGLEDAEMMIAATHSDEVNIVACRIAHTVFHVPLKISRLRHSGYFDTRWPALLNRDHLSVDIAISPEREVARSIIHRLRLPGAFNVIPMAEGRVQLVGVICHGDCPLINTPLKHLTSLFPDLTIEIIAIFRAPNQRIIPTGMEEMRVGDEVYFLTSTAHLDRAMKSFGHDSAIAQRVLIVGGGNVGQCLIEELHLNMPDVQISMIEANAARVHQISERFKKVTIVQGNALQKDVLEEAGLYGAETVISVMNYDEGNILLSMLAKQAGCQKTVTLINNESLRPLVRNFGVDVVVSPRLMTISTILQHIRKGRIKGAHVLRDGFAEILEVEALDTSAVVNKPLSEIRKPKGVLFGMIVRENQILPARASSIIRPDDRVILLAVHEQVKNIEYMFAVRPEYL